MVESGAVCVYQFKVVLRGVSPMIWRRILLRSDQTIADVHFTIHIAVGWSDSHLNRFRIHGKDYRVAHEGGIWFDDNPEKVHLAGFGFRLRERFLYEYDFYDLWEHDVRLEKVLPWKGRLCPVCIAGRRLAPREDCGGTRAYMEQGDPRWGEWSDAWPREDWALMAETMQRVLDSDGASHASSVPLTQVGTGTVRMCLPLPTRSTMAQRPRVAVWFPTSIWRVPGAAARNPVVSPRWLDWAFP